MQYQGRLQRLRNAMEAANIDLLFLPPGANMSYFTGFRRHLNHGAEKNAYGDWATGAYISRNGQLMMLGPRMGGAFFVNEAEGKAWISSVRLIDETEDPFEVMRQTLDQLAPQRQKLAADERSWHSTTLALRELVPNQQLVSAAPLIAPMRMIKDSDEIAIMRRAARMADQAFERSLHILKPGVSEYEVAQEINYQFQMAGADYTSFETNITFVSSRQGSSSGLLRTSLDRRLAVGDSVTFDFGCVLEGYCSDFGRSAFVGEPPAEYLRIHSIVLEAQAAAIAAMKAGKLTASELNAIARRIIAEAGYDAGFTHRLGHGIGASLHEPPFLDNVNQTVLEAGMTFTIEPSIRVPGKFNNRVEDVVMVTENGGDVFNSAAHDLVVVI